MEHYSLTELNKALHNKKISSIELTHYFLDRINSYNSTLNSFISICKDTALIQAKHADSKIQNNQAGLLTGIPLAHKDIFCTQGIKTSCGSKMLDNFISPYNAHIVEQLNAENMVMLGKTNMDEFAMGSSNENSYYGATLNPWDVSKVPGGSSGGSACAVAARLVPACTGSDTGGSIRQPASFCGICGLKPTYGRVSRWGMTAFASSFDQAGIFATSSEDLSLLLQVMAGYDPKDSTSVKYEVEEYHKYLEQPLTGVTIGIPKEYFSKELDSNTANAVMETALTLEKQGCTLQDISLPHTKYASACYYILSTAECSSNLSRYDGVRYGYRCHDPKNLEDLYRRSRGEAFGKEVKRRIMLGTYILSAGYYDAYYVKAQKIRRLIQQDFIQAFQHVNVILSPTTPTAAFDLHSREHDPLAMYLSDIFTISANLAGIPAASFPVGFQNNLPLGAQLMAPCFQENIILQVMHQYQLSTDWHKKSPTLKEINS